MVANDTKKSMVKNWKLNKQQDLKKLLIEKEANKIYGKFGKNTVNKVVNFIMSLQKTPAVNSSRVVNYIQTLRELQSKPPLPLNKKRVIPPKPRVVKRAPIKKKIPLSQKNKVVKKLNFSSNSKSNNNSKLLNNIYANFENKALALKNKNKK